MLGLVVTKVLIKLVADVVITLLMLPDCLLPALRLPVLISDSVLDVLESAAIQCRKSHRRGDQVFQLLGKASMSHDARL